MQLRALELLGSLATLQHKLEGTVIPIASYIAVQTKLHEAKIIAVSAVHST